MASSAVFGSYELLEDILLYLPLRDLLLSQKINKACFDVVQRSESIQKALFLQPSGRPLSAFLGPIREGEGMRMVGFGDWQVDGDSEVVRPIINPFLRVRTVSRDVVLETIHQSVSGSKQPVLIDAGYEDWEAEKVITFAFDRAPQDTPTSSLGSMFVTHPPVGRLQVSESLDHIGSETGTFVGDLMELSRHHAYLDGPRCDTPKGLVVLSLFGTEDWQLLERGVDEIAGVEMLQILSAISKV